MQQSLQKNPKQIAYYYGGDLCSELSYFSIFGFSCEDQTQENMCKGPTYITYREDEITFKEILQRYLVKNEKMKGGHGLRFTLSGGHRIPMKSTVADLKKGLRKANLDGVALFILKHEGEEEDEEEDTQKNDDDINNECAIMQYLKFEKDFVENQNFTFHFLLPKTKFVITLEVRPEAKITALIELFFKEVIKEFKIELTLDDVKEFRIKETKIIIDLKKTIEKHKKLYDNSEIEVILYNKKLEFKQIPQESNIITLVKTHDNSKDNAKNLALNYNEIKNMQISKIHEVYFQEQGQKQNKFNSICLKVMDIILKPNDRLNKLSNVIQKLKSLGSVKLVGLFINEKIIFYKEVPQIMKDQNTQEFTLEQLDIPAEETKNRIQCDERINQRLKIITESYFQNRKHIEPILVYTSSLQFKDKKTGVVSKIYDSLNQTIRSENVLNKDSESLRTEWSYRYASTLLKHLDNIKGQKEQVYRGVNYDPEGKVGEYMTMKSFTSTSKMRGVAVEFALQEYCTKSYLPLTLFQMKILAGKPIDKLSYFGYEQQLLLEPFSEFIITKIERNVKIAYPESTDNFFNFTVYHLQERDTPRQMPQTINNYILWIDDKPNEGQEIFNQFIEEFRYPTVLFQIASTQKLREWISERQIIINDSSSKFIMITNMVRTENGVKNFYAGVQTINLIRDVLPSIPIVVYVRDTQASLRNLQEKNVNRLNLEVISQMQDFTAFVSKHIDVKFRNLFPTEEQLHMKMVQSMKEPPSTLKAANKSKSDVTTSQKSKCNIM